MTYAEVHTCEFDAEAVLASGDSFPVPALDTGAGPVKVGAMILMLRGAEVILVPNSCEMEANRLGQLRARAFENMVGVALANCAKPKDNGHSVAYDAVAFSGDGTSCDILIVEAGESEGVYLAAFDLERLREWRRTEVWGNAFRRPALYGLLSARGDGEPGATSRR